jgi:hypothetical protein
MSETVHPTLSHIPDLFGHDESDIHYNSTNAGLTGTESNPNIRRNERATERTTIIDSEIIYVYGPKLAIANGRPKN